MTLPAGLRCPDCPGSETGSWRRGPPSPCGSPNTRCRSGSPGWWTAIQDLRKENEKISCFHRTEDQNQKHITSSHTEISTTAGKYLLPGAPQSQQLLFPGIRLMSSVIARVRSSTLLSPPPPPLLFPSRATFRASCLLLLSTEIHLSSHADKQNTFITLISIFFFRINRIEALISTESYSKQRFDSRYTFSFVFSQKVVGPIICRTKCLCFIIKVHL